MTDEDFECQEVERMYQEDQVDNKRPVIKGDRNCIRCKGICHEDSLRKIVPQGFGFRAHYFCSYTCLKLYFSLKYLQEYEELLIRQGKEEMFAAEEENFAQEQMHKYEYVDCITP